MSFLLCHPLSWFCCPHLILCSLVFFSASCFHFAILRSSLSFPENSYMPLLSSCIILHLFVVVVPFIYLSLIFFPTLHQLYCLRAPQLEIFSLLIQNSFQSLIKLLSCCYQKEANTQKPPPCHPKMQHMKIIIKTWELLMVVVCCCSCCELFMNAEELLSIRFFFTRNFQLV